MSVPGVGPITALVFRATIDRPERFRRSRDDARALTQITLSTVRRATRPQQEVDVCLAGLVARRGQAEMRAHNAGGGANSSVEPLLAILATMLDQLARLTKQVLDIVDPEATLASAKAFPYAASVMLLTRRLARCSRSE